MFWARCEMAQVVDDEVDAIQAHRETLDKAAIDRDRDGAPDRALFDHGMNANLARNYKAAASHEFFKILDRIEEINADALEAPDHPQETPDGPRASAELASNCQSGPPPGNEPDPAAGPRPTTAPAAPIHASSPAAEPIRTANIEPSPPGPPLRA